MSTTWLDDPALLAHLEVLRLENADFVAAWTEPPVNVFLSSVTDTLERKRRTARRLASFVLARPSIADVTFPDLPESDASLATLRERTGRVLLGADRLNSFERNVPPASETLSAPQRRFLWSAWVFYELLFKDLVLARSGFRPPLPVPPGQTRPTMTPAEALESANSRIPIRLRRYR